eukprot:jgi/Mesvir1/26795/Mv20562-RA.1
MSSVSTVPLVQGAALKASSVTKPSQCRASAYAKPAPAACRPLRSTSFLGQRVVANVTARAQAERPKAARFQPVQCVATKKMTNPYNITREEGLMYYEDMVLGREFEDMCAQMYYRGKMFGFVHLYSGQEAVSTGIIKAMRDDDYVCSTYRDHVHALSKKISAREIMAELYGKATGVCKGMGGSMHMFSKPHNFLGGFAFIGEGIPIATGAAMTVNYNRRALGQKDADQVVACFFGDGTANNGAFFECLNMAALWKLPILFVVENNLWAIGMSHLRATSVPEIHKKGPAFGMPGVFVDGMDVLAVNKVAREAIARARAGEGPTLIECETYRFRGHSLADPDELRSKEEKESYAKRDPIPQLRKYLLEYGLVTEADLDAIHKKVMDVVEDSCEFADESPFPEISQIWDYVFPDPKGFGKDKDGNWKIDKFPGIRPIDLKNGKYRM